MFFLTLCCLEVARLRKFAFGELPRVASFGDSFFQLSEDFLFFSLSHKRRVYFVMQFGAFRNVILLYSVLFPRAGFLLAARISDGSRLKSIFFRSHSEKINGRTAGGLFLQAAG